MAKDIEQARKEAREYKKETSRLASMANKRLKRLQAAGLQETPAYSKWESQGGNKFSVAGKSYNELQAERARINNFLQKETSSIRGVNRTLKKVATSLGLKYNRISELRSKTSAFFEIASKVEQHLRSVHDMASAVGYQKIWEQVNQFTQEHGIEITDNIEEIDRVAGEISNKLADIDEGFTEAFDDWLTLE